MSEHTASAPAKARSANTGKTLLWLAILLSVALLSFVTATAIRNNPLYSDVTTNGMSKYKFIEACKEQLQERLNTFASQPGGAAIAAHYSATETVSGTSAGVQAPPQNGALPPRQPGWTLVTPVRLSREGFPAQTIPMACQYVKGGKVELVESRGQPAQ